MPPGLGLLALLAAVLVLWAGPAAGQTLTFSARHTGSAPVKNGRVQLVEGGAATTFQIGLPADFLTKLKAAHPEANRTGARFGAFFYIIRDSSDVTWDTTSGTTYKDRTAEYTISFSGTEIQPRYRAMSSTLPERTLVYIPLTGTPPGSSSSYASVDDFAASSFPITFSIKAESDTTYLENESIRVRGRFILSGAQASPTFTTVRWNSNDLIFDLVEGALPAPTGKPTTPANLAATAGQGAVGLAWDAVDTTSSNTNLLNDLQITKHQVRQSTDGGANYGTWTDIPDSAYRGVNAVGHTVGGLDNGTEYTFQVRAVNGCTATAGCGNSDASTLIKSTPVAGALARPTGLTATAGNTTVTLSWDDPDDATILAYDYQQKTGTADFGDWTALPLSTLTDHAHRFTGLVNGTRYAWRIRARRSAQTSLPSGAATATPRGAVPAAITLTATPRHSGATLSWSNPRDPAIEEYEYQYKTGSGAYGLWTEIEETDADGDDIENAPHVDTSGATIRVGVGGLTNGAAHTFRVRARHDDGDATSNEVTVTPAAVTPAKPTGLQTWVETTRQFQWDHPRDRSITGYEYSTDGGRTWSAFLINNTGAGMRSPYGARGNLASGEFLSGDRYAFHVRAKNANGHGPASDAATSRGRATRDRAKTSGWNGTREPKRPPWPGTPRKTTP